MAVAEEAAVTSVDDRLEDVGETTRADLGEGVVLGENGVELEKARRHRTSQRRRREALVHCRVGDADLFLARIHRQEVHARPWLAVLNWTDSQHHFNLKKFIFVVIFYKYIIFAVVVYKYIIFAVVVYKYIIFAIVGYKYIIFVVVVYRYIIFVVVVY